ncbi:unnamed protein product [Schistosoma mattheei]|uniref:Uncharacterized protein n=1 Tax=Schistosoma mattheei TaxID=31246 RepID=A0A183Q6H6_9TREM|nr:unnamed protein product [Schistosoma mattheei]
MNDNYLQLEKLKRKQRERNNKAVITKICQSGLPKCDHRVSNSEVRRSVLGNSGKSVDEVVNLHRLRWFGHVLHTLNHRLPRRAMLTDDEDGWKKVGIGQTKTWHHSIKSLSFGLSHLPSSRSLKEKIQQLEEMLSNSSIANANRIAELESQLEPFNRLQKSLNTTVSDLLSLPPPPTLPSHLLSQQSSFTWPPTSVEDQLALLTASEVSARNEIIRLNDSLSLFKEKCKQLECDNQQLYDQLAHCEKNLKSSNSTGNLQISDDFVELSSLAYQICVSLDPEVSEKEWNPDDWEIELFTLLKVSFFSTFQNNL